MPADDEEKTGSEEIEESDALVVLRQQPRFKAMFAIQIAFLRQ